MLATLGTHAVAGLEAAAILLGAAFLAWTLTPPMSRLARRLDAVVRPGGRGIHPHTTPLAGGLAILVPVLAFAVLGFARGETRFGGLLVAAVLLAGMGLLDDTRGMRVRLRLVVQALAGLVLAATGWTLPVLSLSPDATLDLGSWGPPLLVLWVVCCVNAFNMVDGIDGLCSGLTAVAAAAGLLGGAEAGLCAVTVGGSLGFLRHNAPAARVFLGGAGSQLLGLLVAAIALSLPREGNLVLALALVAYPAGDVSLAILRRWVRAKPLFLGDASHVHHKLLGHMGSGRKTLAAVLLFAALEVTIALTIGGLLALVLGVALWMGLVAALLVAGRVGLPRMLSDRRSFRRLHALRTYVESLLRLATEPAEVRAALRRLAEDLGLVHLAIQRLGVIHEAATLPQQVVSVSVPLRLDQARFVYEPGIGDPALERELKGVVVELIRLAQLRLLRLERQGGYARSDTPPGVPTVPEVGR